MGREGWGQDGFFSDTLFWESGLMMMESMREQLSLHFGDRMEGYDCELDEDEVGVR